MKRTLLMKLGIVLVGLGLLASACGNGDGDGDTGGEAQEFE